jgi:hypothetical protein
MSADQVEKKSNGLNESVQKDPGQGTSTWSGAPHPCAHLGYQIVYTRNKIISHFTKKTMSGITGA